MTATIWVVAVLSGLIATNIAQGKRLTRVLLAGLLVGFGLCGFMAAIPAMITVMLDGGLLETFTRALDGIVAIGIEGGAVSAAIAVILTALSRRRS